MCVKCHEFAPDRRRFIALSATSLAVTALFGGTPGLAQTHATTVTADEALTRLKTGNEKYVNGPQLCEVDLASHREQVARAQTPWATILACSDSRVPPELLFGGLGVGELFVARNAGNMVDTATMGTIEYGAEHLGVPLVVVMGHQRCGAVSAACAVVEKHESFPGSIGPMVDTIVPNAQALHGKSGDFVDNTVRESAKRTATKVATTSPIISHLIKEKKVKVVAAYYDLDDGRVEFFT